MDGSICRDLQERRGLLDDLQRAKRVLVERLVVARSDRAVLDANEHFPEPCYPRLLGHDLRLPCWRVGRDTLLGLLNGLEGDASTRHTVRHVDLMLPHDVWWVFAFAISNLLLRTFMCAGCDRRISTH